MTQTHHSNLMSAPIPAPPISELKDEPLDKQVMANLQALDARIDHVYIDRVSLSSSVAKRAMKVFAKEKIEIVEAPPLSKIRGQLSAREFNQSKRQIFITEFKGSFFKRCPGAKPGLACCNYYVLNLGIQCDMNCSYCYLQSFINTPVLTVYSNLDKALAELKEIADVQGAQPFRVGTGETIDSLSLDELTLYSRELIAFFRNYPNWKLEFKTKSNRVAQFLNTPHAGNVIVSWSVNPQYIIDHEEHATASLDERLRAAELCVQNGFQVTFHIDPMIWHPEWRESYRGLAEEIHRRFKPEQVGVMSIGALRFQPEQRHIMRERFSVKSLVVSAEVFQGDDGKLRYDQATRQEMFNFMIDQFRALDPRWKISLCMETPESWLASSYQSAPRRVEGLEEFFQPLTV